jgi:hypothetical protein
MCQADIWLITVVLLLLLDVQNKLYDFRLIRFFTVVRKW